MDNLFQCYGNTLSKLSEPAHWAYVFYELSVLSIFIVDNNIEAFSVYNNNTCLSACLYTAR